MKRLIGSKKRAINYKINGLLPVIAGVLLLVSSLSYAKGHNVSDRDTSVSAYMQQYLGSGGNGLMLAYPNSVERFYEADNLRPVWIDRDHTQTWDAMMLLDCVTQYGLFHADYHPDELLYQQLQTMIQDPSKISNQKKARFDIYLTDAMITLMNNLHYGKLNPFYSADKIDSGLMIPFHAETELAAALQGKDFRVTILSVQPQSKQYAAMQDYMHLLKGQYQGDCYQVPESVVRKVAINMERLRWAEIGGSVYIQVNIPSFNLKFYQPDTTYEFKVVVGKTSAPTPVLKSQITYFTTTPEWKIPQKIFTNEILPKALRDARYLDNSHFSIYNRKGEYINPTKAKLLEIKRHPQLYYARQSAGCDNALGNIVFRFANIYDIYLHDTPEQQLFKRDERAFSHSCIRVERARDLAALLLRSVKDDNKIPVMDRALKLHLTRNISLKTPVPIKITYLTCEMKQGTLITYKDIYNLDNSLEMALYNASDTLTMQ
ncbi:MAG TPA: L,D-transpeptidase family protein [Mucilaginibacter sp.]|nr:L,D-transpeptidase family protein [Mucilaginibacter sp.]